MITLGLIINHDIKCQLKNFPLFSASNARTLSSLNGNLNLILIKNITVNKYKMLPYLNAHAQNSGSCEVSPQRRHVEHVLAKRAINKCID